MKKLLFIVLITVKFSFAQETVPFNIIEDVPIFPGCEKLDAIGKKDCMNIGINEIIKRNFNLKKATRGITLDKGLIKIFVSFKIDENGIVDDIKIKAPHPKIEKETARVINLIPKMRPGLHLGKPVKVAYTLPIKFRIN